MKLRLSTIAYANLALTTALLFARPSTFKIVCFGIAVGIVLYARRIEEGHGDP